MAFAAGLGVCEEEARAPGGFLFRLALLYLFDGE